MTDKKIVATESAIVKPAQSFGLLDALYVAHGITPSAQKHQEPFFRVGESIVIAEWDVDGASLFQHVRDCGEPPICAHCGDAWDWKWTDSDHDTRSIDHDSAWVEYTIDRENLLHCQTCDHAYAEVK